MGKTSFHHTRRKPQRSQVVAVYMPRRDFSQPKVPPKTTKNPISTFRQAFMQTLQGNGQGLLTAHLYHEPANDGALQMNDSTSSTLHQRFNRILYGGQAWDAFIKEGGSYQCRDSDINAINSALADGLVNSLPDNMRLVEYGPGGKNGVSKPAQLIKSIMQHKPGQIYSYVAVDILNRFATESALEIHEEFNLRSFAIVGDFTAREKLVMPKAVGTTPVVLSFGGGFANAPDHSLDNGHNGKANATAYFSQMNRQFGLGSYVLMSYHSERDPQKLMQEYQRTDALEAFILSGFMRALGEGIITDKNYDPFQHWKMEPAYDEKICAVVEYAVCQKDHTLRTDDGNFDFKAGDRLPITLSHKWNDEDYKGILKKAGYDIVDDKVYKGENMPRGVILAKAVRRPSPVPALTAG